MGGTRMKKIFAVLVISLMFTGCAKLAHIKELLTLDSLSKNKALQAETVRIMDKSFDKLREAVKYHQVKDYSDQTSFIRIFGGPVYMEKVKRNGEVLDQWLYRYAVDPETDKVYIYWDKNRTLVDYTYVPFKKKE